MSKLAYYERQLEFSLPIEINDHFYHVCIIGGKKRYSHAATQIDCESARSVPKNAGRNGLYKTVLPG